jgi:hypothetical protein
VHSPLSHVVDLDTKLISDNSTIRTFFTAELYIRAFVVSQSIPFDLELRNRKAKLVSYIFATLGYGYQTRTGTLSAHVFAECDKLIKD